MEIVYTIPKRERETYSVCFNDLFGMEMVCLSYKTARELFERILFKLRSQKRKTVHFMGDLESEVRYVAYAIGWIPIDKWSDNGIWLDNIFGFLMRGESKEKCSEEFIKRYCDEKCVEECEWDFCEEGYESCFSWCVFDMKMGCGENG